MSEGIKGTMPCALFGVPLDGAKYRDLPDIGQPYTDAVLTLPLGEPVESTAHAVYRCRGNAPVSELWQFFYERTEYPPQAQVTEQVAPATPANVQAESV